MTKQIQKYIETHFNHYKSIAQSIHAKPEVSNYEFFACQTHSENLKNAGFEVQTDVAGHRTAFDARYKAKKEGPTIVFLAEYDALPGIGHACGHNIFGTTSALAAAALKEVIDEHGGEIRVYGTPGEEGGENGSAKGSFVREAFFEDVDAALCLHPGYQNSRTSTSLANDPVDVEFFGKASHAAAIPEQGINALDAIIQVYNGVNALRQHLTDDVRIHGVITHGGEAANVVPEYASARFYLRAQTRETLQDVYQKFDKIVQGAALMTGCTYRFGLFQNSVDNTVVTPQFDDLYQEVFESLGGVMTDHNTIGGGSTDVGNVSQVVPTIQPTISISDEYIAGHSIEFREAANSDRGYEAIAIGAQALALTALRLIQEPDTLKAIQADHQASFKNQ